MKRFSLPFSLLLHLLFFLFVIWLSPSAASLHHRPVVIDIMPLAPPGQIFPGMGKQPRLQVPVYVRPFALPGNGMPAGGGRKPVSGKSGRIPPRSPLVPVPQRPRPAGKEMPPGVLSGGNLAAADPGKSPPVLLPGRTADPVATVPGRLRISIAELMRKWGMPQGRAGSPPSEFGRGESATSIPFEDHGGGLPGEGMPGGTGATAIAGSAFFDSRGYDITPWAKRVVYRIKHNWIYPATAFLGQQEHVEIALVIERDGRISTLRIVSGSSYMPFNQSAVNALELSVPFPPLPDDFPNSYISAYLVFRYN